MKLLSYPRWILVSVCVLSLALAWVFIVRAQVNPFGQPTNFNATAISACEIDLGWDAQNAASFEIQRSKDNTFFTGVTSTTTPGSATSWNDIGLPTSTLFYYQMRAKNASGNNSAWSDPGSATTLDLNAPSAPGITSGTGVGGNKQIQIAFTIPAPLSNYGGLFVERATMGSNNFTVVNQGNPLPSSFPSPYSDNNGGANLNPSVAYQYRLRSFESGEGCGDVKAYSPYSSVVVVPTPPSALSASYAYDPRTTSDSVGLSWNGSKGQDFYEVWRGVNSDASIVKYATSPASSYTDTGVQVNTKYFYKVRACSNSGGCSDFSNEDSRTVASAPQNLSASIAAVYSGNPGSVDVALSWDNTFPDRNYYLERATSTTGVFEQVGGTIPGPGSSVVSISHSDKGLQTGGTYVYRVRSKFGTNFTNYSNLASVDTNVTPLIGWAWAMADAPHGIGWIKFDSATAPADSIAYGVYRDSNNVLSGYAWSGIKCAAGEGRPATGTGSTCGYGWLSFNEQSGCPSGGDCAARFNPTTNKLSGWAKFTAADPSKGSWDGWVSLNAKGSEPVYAVEYDPATGKFVPGAAGNTSWAWGSSVTGWMSFYDVGGGPLMEEILDLIATPLDCVNGDPNNCPVRLEWTNPVSFSSVDLFRCLGDSNNCCKAEKLALDSCRSSRGSCAGEMSNWSDCKDNKFGTQPFRDNIPETTIGPQSRKEENLPEKTTHSFLIEGSY